MPNLNTRGPTRHHHLFVHTRDAIKVSIMKGTSSSISECIQAKTNILVHQGVAKNHTQPKEPSSFICVYMRNSNLFVIFVGNLSLRKLTYNNTCNVVTGGSRTMCRQVFKWPKKRHKHKDSCKACASLELKKIKRLSDLRVKATAQGLECKPKKKVIKKEKKK